MFEDLVEVVVFVLDGWVGIWVGRGGDMGECFMLVRHAVCGYSARGEMCEWIEVYGAALTHNSRLSQCLDSYSH